MYDVDPGLGVIALARANEFDFGFAMEPDWFPFIFKDDVRFKDF